MIAPRTSDDTSRLPVTGAVLAGGRSRRMGTDKALVSVGGELLVTRVASTLAEVCSRVIVVASDAEALVGVDLPEGAGVIADIVAFQGPLGGLATALAAAETEWVFAVGVDMPFLHSDILRVLWEELAEASSRLGHSYVHVVMPMGDAGPEPLLSLYRVDCLDAVHRALAEGTRRVVDLCSQVNVLGVPIERFESVDPKLLSLVNVNTAEDLASAQTVAETHDAKTPRPQTEGAARL